jgi:RNA polymerase sigma-70 factor (ECF subfamily)
VIASQAGDSSAFEQLVSRYDHKLFKIAHHIVGNVADAEDMVQETLIKAFQHIGQFQRQSKLSTWLYRIVVNQCLMHVRRQRGKPALADLYIQSSKGEGHLPIDFSDWRPNPEEQYAESELKDLLTRLLQDLSPVVRVVFIMHDIEGYPLQEVAEALGVTLSAVKTRSRRARFYLRERLTMHFKKDLHEMLANSSHSSIRGPAAAFA